MMGRVPRDHQDIIKGKKPSETFQFRNEVEVWSIDYRGLFFGFNPVEHRDKVQMGTKFSFLISGRCLVVGKAAVQNSVLT